MKQNMTWWAVVVEGSNYILIGFDCGRTESEAIRNARIDYEDACTYWENECKDKLMCITPEEYRKTMKKNKDWAVVMAG